jgi:hypothetical protein
MNELDALTLRAVAMPHDGTVRHILADCIMENDAAGMKLAETLRDDESGPRLLRFVWQLAQNRSLDLSYRLLWASFSTADWNANPKPTPEPDQPTRTLDKRLIFRFWDGQRKRAADPIAVERVLVHYLTDDWRGKVISLSDKPPVGMMGEQLKKFWKDKEELRLLIYRVIGAAFNVKPFKDDEGLTDIEMRALIDGYVRFCNDLLELARRSV